MKKISKETWEQFKNSQEGKNAIAMFKKLHNPQCKAEDMLAIAQKVDSEYFNGYSEQDEQAFIEKIKTLKIKVLKGFADLQEYGSDNLGNEYFDIVELYINTLCEYHDVKKENDITSEQYKESLDLIMPITMVLNSEIRGFFYPSFFVKHPNYLLKFAEKYDITIPYDLNIPDIVDEDEYYDCHLYFACLSGYLEEFAEFNGVDHHELCAFIYCYEIPQIINH